MKFFFPDSQDLVDPSFDFERERRSVDRLRQRDDLYAHELFSAPAFDGFLVSKGIVDGFGGVGGRYSIAQRQRLLRLGAPDFLRVYGRKPPLPILGDCGAFTYVKEETPPYGVEELVEFYDECGFDMGISLDHVILAHQPGWDESNTEGVPEDVRNRQRLTLEFAKQFLALHKKYGLKFEPLGAAQGWSPKSYATSVKALQKMGYEYIALGGMVPLKTPEILACLKAIDAVRSPKVKLHLLGVTRTDHIREFARFGVASFDSTSPLRQAFKDASDNYYAADGGRFTAIRIPQVEGNPRLQKAIRAGRVAHDEARKLERASLAAMKLYAAEKMSVEKTLAILCEYEHLYSPGSDHTEAYRRTLEVRPWAHCSCEVCVSLGHHVILFRGAERNRRRGFHNLWMFYRTVRTELGLALPEAA